MDKKTLRLVLWNIAKGLLKAILATYDEQIPYSFMYSRIHHFIHQVDSGNSL